MAPVISDKTIIHLQWPDAALNWKLTLFCIFVVFRYDFSCTPFFKYIYIPVFRIRVYRCGCCVNFGAVDYNRYVWHGSCRFCHYQRSVFSFLCLNCTPLKSSCVSSAAGGRRWSRVLHGMLTESLSVKLYLAENGEMRRQREAHRIGADPFFKQILSRASLLERRPPHIALIGPSRLV